MISARTATPATMISARRGPMPLTSGAALQVQRAHLLKQVPHLLAGGCQRVGLVPTRSLDLVDGTHHGRGGGRGGDHAVHTGLAESLEGAGQAVAHVFLQARDLPRVCGIALQIDLGEADGPERLREGLDHPAVLGEDQLSAAAADVHDQDGLPQFRPASLHPALHQPGFLLAADHVERRAHDGRGTRHELDLIRRVAQRGRADGTDGLHLEVPVLAGHPLEHAARQVHR